MSGENEPEIVVTAAKVDSSGVVYGYLQLPPGTHFYSPNNVSEDGSGEDANFEYAIIISVRLSDRSKQPEAVQAAQRLAQAVARVRAMFARFTDAYVSVHGTLYHVASVLGQLERTDFVVTDRVNFSNPGVGAAQYNENGRNSDTINYSQLLHGCGAPSYTNDEGMTALVLHELGHLNPAGYQFFIANDAKWHQEPSSYRGNDFYASEYASNVEAFANDFMTSIASATGLDIVASNGPVIPGGITNAVDPQIIFNRHSTNW